LSPGKRIYPVVNIAFAIGSIFMATQMAIIRWPVPESKGVVLSAPFRGDWLVLHGGRSMLINNHFSDRMREALEMERLVDGKEESDKRRKKSSGSYPSWGQTIYAPADGKIVRVVSDRKDNASDGEDEEHFVGNYISMDIGQGRYVMMGRLQQGSALV